MQGGIEGVPAHGERCVRGKELLPWDGAHAFEELIERSRREVGDTHKDAFGAAQVEVCPGEDGGVSGKEDAAVFGGDVI